MKYTELIDNYLIDNKLHLNEVVRIYCCKTDGVLYDNVQKLISISGSIEVTSYHIDRLNFIKNEQHFSHFTHLTAFLQINCLSKSDIRNTKIDNLLE